jgi:translation initiation factor 1
MRGRTTDRDTLVYDGERGRQLKLDAPSARPAPSRAQHKPDGVVRIWLERKGRNGGPVSIVRGFPGDRDALLALAARLKKACGTGGSAKDGEIIIQGDHRERIAAALTTDGLRVKLAGG